jgi:hypothetical protein
MAIAATMTMRSIPTPDIAWRAVRTEHRFRWRPFAGQSSSVTSRRWVRSSRPLYTPKPSGHSQCRRRNDLPRWFGDAQDFAGGALRGEHDRGSKGRSSSIVSETRDGQAMGSRLSGSHTATLPTRHNRLELRLGDPWDKYEARNDEGQDDSLEEVHHPIRFSTFWFAHLARRHLEVPLFKEAEADAEPNAAVRHT